jgi:transcription antitermination factor NusG
MASSKKWHAIYTKPRWEKKVFAALEQQGIVAYCPLSKVVKQWSDRRKVVELPLFTSYVFVQIRADEQLKVRMTNGVVNFVYWLGALATIRDEEMKALQDFVANHQQIQVEPLNYAKGDQVEIGEGLMKGQKAIVHDVRKNKLVLVLESLNIKLVVPYIAPK